MSLSSTRKRTDMACCRCRQRKIKCESRKPDPCASCAEKHVECKYMPVAEDTEAMRVTPPSQQSKSMHMGQTSHFPPSYPVSRSYSSEPSYYALPQTGAYPLYSGDVTTSNAPGKFYPDPAMIPRAPHHAPLQAYITGQPQYTTPVDMIFPVDPSSLVQGQNLQTVDTGYSFDALSLQQQPCRIPVTQPTYEGHSGMELLSVPSQMQARAMNVSQRSSSTLAHAISPMSFPVSMDWAQETLFQPSNVHGHSFPHEYR